jgi:disulfide bond formation protein DsbB
MAMDMSGYRLAMAATILMAGTIAAVLGFEHLAGFIPCKLCLQQREPYYAAIPVALVALASAGRAQPPCLFRGLMTVAGLLMLYTATLAAFHSGVEWAWWQGPGDCGATAGNISANANDLLADLSAKRAPSCTEAAGRFLGLSFAGWNVLASLAIAAMAFRAALLGAHHQGSSTESQ